MGYSYQRVKTENIPKVAKKGYKIDFCIVCNSKFYGAVTRRTCCTECARIYAYKPRRCTKR